MTADKKGQELEKSKTRGTHFYCNCSTCDKSVNVHTLDT